MMNGLGIAALAVTSALEHGFLRRRGRALERLAGEGARQLDLVACGDVIERHRVEALQGGVRVTMDLEIAGNVGTGQTELIGR